MTPKTPVAHEEKKHSLTYTENVAQNPRTQDQEYPVPSKLNWNNPLKGVRKHSLVCGFQFISDDETR